METKVTNKRDEKRRNNKNFIEINHFKNKKSMEEALITIEKAMHLLTHISIEYKDYLDQVSAHTDSTSESGKRE